MGKRRKKFSMGSFVFLLSIVTLAFAGLVTWSGYEFFRSEFPDVSVLKTQYPVVRYRGKKLPPAVKLQKSRPAGWVTLREISPNAIGAVVVSEDWAFYQHKGYDPTQIKEAIQEDIEAGTFKRGASTITQQVVKNVFLESDKNLWRKVKELLLAVRIESHVGKKKILETYLNIAEWGEGIFGIRQAARHYYGKHPSQLTPKEGAFLAMLLPSPIRYGQSYRRGELTRYANRTVRSIIRKMAQAQYISQEERDRAIGSRLPFEKAIEEAPPQEEAGSTDTNEDPGVEMLTPEESGMGAGEGTEL